MSDKTEKRPILGNLSRHRHLERHREKNIISRSLVEESPFIDITGCHQIYGRETLMQAADKGRPIWIRLGSRSYQVYLTWSPHRLPGKAERWSDIRQQNCRLYFICPSCRRHLRILYEHPQSSMLDSPSIGCRRCLRLTYASENSCKTKWWKEIVKPLKRLYLRREKLLTRKRTERIAEELDRIEELIFIYTQRAKPKGRTQRTSGTRRPYRNVSLIIGNH